MAPTPAPTDAGSFTHACLADCPCPDQSKANATCAESKAFAVAATRPGETCASDCDESVRAMVGLAAARQCGETGADGSVDLDWGEADTRSGDDVDYYDNGDPWPRRLQATSSVCTLAPTKAPTKAPTPSPTSPPTLAPTGGVCRTSASLPAGSRGKGRACVFPFTYKGRTYTGCTDVDSDDGLWCSTKTDWWGNHVGGEGEWGTCVDRAPSRRHRYGPPSGCDLPCRTSGWGRAGPPPSPRRPCVFPFVFRGVTYTACAPEDDVLSWCSTMTDLFDRHIPGNWGYCNVEGCPVVAQPTPSPVLVVEPVVTDLLNSKPTTMLLP